MRQLEPRNRGLGRELHRTIRIEPLLNARLRRGRATRVACDLRDSPVAIARAVQILRRYGAPKLQSPIGSVDPTCTAVNLDGAQERADTAAHHFEHIAEPTIARVLAHAYASAIAMHDAAHLPWRQEDAFVHAFDAQESVPRAVRAHDSFDDRTRMHRERCAARCAGRRSGAASIRTALRRVVATVARAELRRACAPRTDRFDLRPRTRFRLRSRASRAIPPPELSTSSLQWAALIDTPETRAYIPAPSLPAQVAKLVDA